MKFRIDYRRIKPLTSPPSQGAWIEITTRLSIDLKSRSPPSQGAWIEIFRLFGMLLVMPSPPSQGAWIEITVSAGRWPRL